MKAVFTTAVGIDVHRDTVVVSVRKRGPTGGDDPVETRTFDTFRDDLVKMTEWLDAEGAEVVGLESTGVYWMPIVRVIQEQLPKVVVWLVNPVEVKGRRGRKTDRKDSRRLSELVLYGQVTPSFVPSYQQSELRKLTRHRTKLVADQTRYTNRIIKELESSGVKLASVLSDCLGKSGRAMIDALLEGKPTANVAQLAKGVLRKKIPLIERAVAGSFTPSTKLVLRQLLRLLDDVTTQMSAAEEEIAKLMQPWQSDRDLMVTSPGIDDISSAAVIAEMGGDMALFSDAKHLTAWAGIAPGSEESAGKAKSAPARKGNKYLRTVLVQSAWSAVRTKGTFWTAVFRRLRARLGPKKAIVAIARKMLVALFHMLRDRTPYRPPEPLPPSPQQSERLVRRLLGKIEALGYAVQVTSPPSRAPAETVS